ncbi:MAG: pseudouridine synthase [Deltaproteobacteria bacterium RIFOXYD12_FULL_57_12]|nr:MAG: pseudouridine synthase [Deltaproteobacteria bacterium RIFOXYD12_FULL_57_12]
MEERLQKILARAGIASRRTAEEYIKQGRVRIDGQIVTDMGIRVDPSRHRIDFDGRPIAAAEKKIYLLLNKPKGYVTTLRDPEGRPVVTSLLMGIAGRLFPVGRLDMDTEGALLLTNDGDLAQRILHPSYEVRKTYVAKVVGQPDQQKLDQLSQGIMLEGRRTWPAKLRVLARTKQDSTIEIIIHEGRKRQVRLMFAAIGHRVIDLKRTAYGNLQIGGLPSGKYRLLSREDLDLIFSKKKNSLQ